MEQSEISNFCNYISNFRISFIFFYGMCLKLLDKCKYNKPNFNSKWARFDGGYKRK